MLINLYAILKWFERTWRFWVGVVFVLNVSYLVHVYRMQQPKQEPIVQVTIEDDKLLLRVEALEKRLEDQQKVISWYDTYNQTSQTNFKRLDKNQQNQTEVLKRMCEYIWVITIDKKIIPRQCYPDYNWRREE